MRWDPFELTDAGPPSSHHTCDKRFQLNYKRLRRCSSTFRYSHVVTASLVRGLVRHDNPISHRRTEKYSKFDVVEVVAIVRPFTGAGGMNQQRFENEK